MGKRVISSHYRRGTNQSSGEILKKTMKTADFEADKSTVLKIYISDVYYEKLVKQAEKEHPLEFELNQGQ